MKKPKPFHELTGLDPLLVNPTDELSMIEASHHVSLSEFEQSLPKGYVENLSQRSSLGRTYIRHDQRALIRFNAHARSFMVLTIDRRTFQNYYNDVAPNYANN